MAADPDDMCYRHIRKAFFEEGLSYIDAVERIEKVGVSAKEAEEIASNWEYERDNMM